MMAILPILMVARALAKLKLVTHAHRMLRLESLNAQRLLLLQFVETVSLMELRLAMMET